MTQPSTPPDRPSLGQAFGLIAAAILLLTSTCFGVFGISAAMPGSAGELIVPFALLVGLVGLGGLLIGVAAIFGRIFGRKAPASDSTVSAPLTVDAPPPARPTFAQAALLLIAGTVVFSSTCFAVVDSGTRSSARPVAIVFFVLGMLLSLWGFGTMIVRLWSAWGGRSTSVPHIAGDAPTAPIPDATGSKRDEKEAGQ